MKVTMTEAICQEGLALLEGKADIFVAHDAHPHNYLDQLKDTDAFIVRVADKGAIDKETMESSDSLKVIGRTGIGYDSVDVESATKLGIPVVVTPGANNRSVAEHAITLMLALSKNMVESDVEQRKGNWKIRDAKKAFEVEEKTCLIIGLGTIGKIIAHGDTREQAIARMRVALSELAVEGIKTNTKLHRELLADERFFQGGTSIHYLEEKLRSRAEAHK